jgi:two-component system sensor histidine kinase GlrK
LQFAYPKSFLTLLLIGFSLIALPFLFAFANATLYLDNITQQSRVAVTQAVQATRDSRTLVEQLTVMERVTRQYMVVGDMALLDNYLVAHRKFDETANALGSLLKNKTQQAMLDEITAKVDKLSAQMALGDPNTLKRLPPEFPQLFDSANEILAASNQMIDEETIALQKAAEHAQRTLMWQALSLIPFTLIVTIAITYVIGRPLRQIEAAIHDIGSGKLDDEIDITGPEDMRKLGYRLNWLRSQLANLDAQKNRFLGEVSHELKTPLTAIRESSELLQEGVYGQLTPAQHEITNILQSNSLRLQHMIEDLLNYSAARFQASATPEPVELHDVLRRVLADHALTISSRQLRLIANIGKVSLIGDSAKLMTLCDNLISNAIKFAPQSGTVRVSLQSRDGIAILDVFDSGPGVSAEDRPHIFEPFYQGSAPQGSYVKGSGLGLSIARDCVAAHNGDIEIIDNPAWKGAVFRVTLPLPPLKVSDEEVHFS